MQMVDFFNLQRELEPLTLAQLENVRATMVKTGRIPGTLLVSGVTEEALRIVDGFIRRLKPSCPIIDHNTNAVQHVFEVGKASCLCGMLQFSDGRPVRTGTIDFAKAGEDLSVGSLVQFDDQKAHYINCRCMPPILAPQITNFTITNV